MASDHVPAAGAVMRVARGSDCNLVAGAVAKSVRLHGTATLSSVGATATSTAVKALAVARRYLANNALDLSCVPSFVTAECGGNEVTTIRFAITGHSIL